MAGARSGAAARVGMIEIAIHDQRGGFTLDAAFSTDARVAALFGPSGAGKSTIIRTIAGLHRPRSGTVILNNVPLLDTAKGISVAPHRRRIGVVFQDAMIFPHLTVRQNLHFGRFFTPRSERRIPFAPVIEALGLSDLLERRPRHLSGGEIQRVGLARALLASPALLLMDEPLASLDNARRVEIMRLIERVRDEFAIPILYVSHSVEEIGRLADEAIVLEAGQIVAQGPPASALANARRILPGGRFGLASPLTCIAGAFDAQRGITRLEHPAGPLFITGPAGRAGQSLRIMVPATDVALALHRPDGISIRNMLEGTIETIALDGALALAEVRLTGRDLLCASITALACQDLALAPGQPIICLLKSVALDERPLA